MISLGDRREGGTVTAEIAVVMPAIVMLLALIVGSGQVAQAQLQCDQAARIAARAGARGDDPATARALAARTAPAGATISIETVGGMIHGQVRARISMVGLPGPTMTVTWRASALLEEP